MKPLSSNELFGNWATLILPIADDESIRYTALEEEIDALISMRVNGIYSNGTAGEFYTQTEEEFDRVSSMLAEKCNAAGMPFQIGCNHSSPQIALERIKRAVALKPSAIQVILPDWFPPTLEEIMVFLERVTVAAQPVGIVLYNPPHAKVKLMPSDFEAILKSGIPLIGCKVAGGDEHWYEDMKRKVPEISVFVAGHTLATGIVRGARGSYSNVACLQPRGAQTWYEMMTRDMTTALEMEKRIQQFIYEHVIPYITEEKYSNTAIDKFLAAVGNWADTGTRVRWPYKSIPEAEVISTREKGRQILPEFFEQ